MCAGPGPKCLELYGAAGTGKVITALHVVAQMRQAAAAEGAPEPFAFAHITCKQNKKDFYAQLLQVCYPALHTTIGSAVQWLTQLHRC